MADKVVIVTIDPPGSDFALSLNLLTDFSPEHKVTGRNATKADILFYRVGGESIALKTYENRSWLVRALLGRWLIRREVAAYSAAAGIEGLPHFFGQLGSVALATGWVPARSLAELHGEVVEDRVFDRLESIVADLHKRGVALADMHRGDVLLTSDNDVFLVDLAMAWILGEQPSWIRRRIFVHLCGLDRISLARMRAHFSGADAEAVVDQMGGAPARWHRRGRTLKGLWNRLRGRTS